MTEHNESVYPPIRLSPEGWRASRDTIRRETQDVTICIAAMCNDGHPDGKCLICCTDWRATSELGTTDMFHKQAPLFHGFVCLLAGDTSEATLVSRLMKAKFMAANSVDETNVVDLVKQSLYARRAQRRNALAQQRFGIDHDEILKIGKDKLPPEHLSRYLDMAATIRLESEFVVAGMTQNDDFILETTSACDVVMPSNFGCAGEGEFLARSSLLHREIDHLTPVDTALYYVFEAKKAAERVKSVGTTTLLTLLYKDGRDLRVRFDKMEELDRLYRAYGPQRVPRNLKLPEGLIEPRL